MAEAKIHHTRLLSAFADRSRNRKFLGFTVSRDGARIKVADKAIEKLKATIRELTRRIPPDT